MTSGMAVAQGPSMRRLPLRFVVLPALLALPLGGCVAPTSGPGSEGTASTSEGMSICGQTTVKGMDISHYDGTIDWPTAKAGGISFAFAKATESTNYTDPTFA